MDKYTATEQAYKHGYEKGYEDGKPKWIPISERLPEVGKTVIALGSRGGVYTAQYTGGVYWHKLNARCHMCEPTHWMPLPEPPQEGE